MHSKWSRIENIVGISGLFVLAFVILNGSAYPDVIFRIGILIGLLLVFISLLLSTVPLVGKFVDAVRTKRYTLIVILLVVAVYKIFVIFRN